MTKCDPSEFGAILYEVTGAVATITLNRPEVANAQDTRLIDEVPLEGDLLLRVALVFDIVKAKVVETVTSFGLESSTWFVLAALI